MRTLIPHLLVGLSQQGITRNNNIKKQEQHTITSLLGRLPWDLLGLFRTLRYFTCTGNYGCLYSFTDLLHHCSHDRLNHSNQVLMFPDRLSHRNRVLEPPDRLSYRYWVLQPPDRSSHRYWVLKPSPPATNRKLLNGRLTALSEIRRIILGIVKDLSVFVVQSFHIIYSSLLKMPITWAK